MYIPNFTLSVPLKLKKPFEVTLALLFIVILNMDFAHFRQMHITLQESHVQLTLIFFKIQNKPFTTIRWLLHDS
jgi:hypothetical protein